MKILIIMAVFFGLIFILGFPSRGDAICLAFCEGDVDKETAVNVEADVEVNDSALSAGDGNTSAVNTHNSVVIGGSLVTRQSNYIGGIGINRGDITQSNSANITGNQNTHIHGNDMRTSRGSSGNSN